MRRGGDRGATEHDVKLSPSLLVTDTQRPNQNQTDWVVRTVVSVFLLPRFKKNESRNSGIRCDRGGSGASRLFLAACGRWPR